MRRRPGITLIEVLIAIFIMTIGLLALLTLFPLGALRMSQALQDDRDAAAASAAANICDAFGVRQDPNFIVTPPIPPTNLFLTPPNAAYPPASQSGAGIPVFVDPYGVANGSGSVLGGAASDVTTPNPQTPGIWRVVPSVIPANIPEFPLVPPPPPTTTLAARYFTLLDDMTFTPGGIPDTSSGVIQRGGRYTWGYLLHKSQPGSPSSPVDLIIVVYAGRPTQVPSGESTYAAAGAINSTSVVLTHAGTPPTIRRGSWVLDTSYDSPNGSLFPSGAVHGDFYRVVSITTVDATHVSLELQTPVGKNVTAVTVMDNVAEVFLRGTDDSTKWEFR